MGINALKLKTFYQCGPYSYWSFELSVQLICRNTSVMFLSDIFLIMKNGLDMNTFNACRWIYRRS